jgi:hypothetical protein
MKNALAAALLLLLAMLQARWPLKTILKASALC